MNSSNGRPIASGSPRRCSGALADILEKRRERPVDGVGDLGAGHAKILAQRAPGQHSVEIGGERLGLARAEVAAYSDCTEAQMMSMFGWRDNKMPALYIAKASRDKLAISGMEKIEAYDQMENVADLAVPTYQNRIVTFEPAKRAVRFQRQMWGWCARRMSIL